MNHTVPAKGDIEEVGLQHPSLFEEELKMKYRRFLV
jgi:hypothetical protein